MLHLKQEQDQQAVLKRWILKILAGRNCSTGETQKQKVVSQKGQKALEAEKSQINLAKSVSSISAHGCQTGIAGPILLGWASLSWPLACTPSFGTSLRGLCSNTLQNSAHLGLGQGCSGAQGTGGPAAGHRRQCSATPRGVSLRMHTEQSLAKGFVPQEPYPTKSSPVTCSSSHINAPTHTSTLNSGLAHGCAQLLCHLPSMSFFCPFYESHI